MTGPKLLSFAPKGTPGLILNHLHDDTIKALRSKDVVQPLASQGAEGVGNSPQETQKFIQSEIAPWTWLVKQAKSILD